MVAKKIIKRGLTENILVLSTDVVETKTLKVHHKNPRVGDIDAIAESLGKHGQFRPILVNKGSKTGRPNEILAGNHTFLAARKLGWPQIYASFVDVDEDTGTRIVLVDNKTADAGTYDEKVLADLFASLPDIAGTGYSDIEVDSILADVEKSVAGMVEEAETQQKTMEEEERAAAQAKTFAGAEFGEEPEEGDEGYDDDEPSGTKSLLSAPPRVDSDEDGIEDAEEELAGLIDLKDELPEGKEFYAPGYWQLPALRRDMYVTASDIPWDNLRAWAGSATKEDDDPDRWWLYNWGIDSTSGMQQDKSQVVISFYAYDQYFENWFWTPKKFVTKALNSKIKFIATPNYSMWPDQSRFLNLWALYRARWCGRYFQEAGMKVIPDINWPMGDNEFLKKYVLGSLSVPKGGMPLIMMQLQTWDEKEVEANEATQIEAYKLIIDTLNPKAILLYSNRPGREWFEKNVPYSGEVHLLETRLAHLSEAAKKREKKKGI